MIIFVVGYYFQQNSVTDLTILHIFHIQSVQYLHFCRILNDLLSIVLCDKFYITFALGSFSALSNSLYHCVYCFISVFVLFVQKEIIIIIIISL